MFISLDVVAKTLIVPFHGKIYCPIFSIHGGLPPVFVVLSCFTDHVRSIREGNNFTGVCQSVQSGGGCRLQDG